MRARESNADGNREACGIEQYLHRLRRLFRSPKRLHRRSRASEKNGFRERERCDSDQDEQEAYRDGAGNSGQAHLHRRGQQREREVREKAREILEITAFTFTETV